MEVLRLGTYIATQFKPIVAKVIYNMTDAKTVLDTSMGWGDRLAGFFASNATHYIGCDPNPNTFKVYSEMIREYSKMSPGKTTQIYRCGAEDLPWDTIKDVDCAFTISSILIQQKDIMREVNLKKISHGVSLQNMKGGEMSFISQWL